MSDQQWLRERVAGIVPQIPTEALDALSLRDLGVQSVDLIVLLADIEDRLGVRLDDADLDDRNFVDIAALERLLAQVRSRHG